MSTAPAHAGTPSDEGPRKLPEIGKTLGRGLGEFRRATADLKRTIEEEVKNIPEDDDPPSSKTSS